MPRQLWLHKLELRRQETQHLQPLPLESGQRPCRTAELHRQPLGSHLPKAAPRLEHGDEPARCLVAERLGNGLLEQGTGCHRRRAMLIGKRRKPGRDAIELSADEIEGTSRDEHRSGVDHVLARRAPVYVAGCIGSRSLPKSPDERLRGVADRSALLQQLAEVVELQAADVDDRVCRFGGHDACGRLCARERALDLEHRREPRLIGDCGEDLLRYEERPERRHTRKNAVWSSPWRQTSKRSPPFSWSATSVARSLSSSSESTGSAAFASSSSGK